nr:Phox-associated domain, sorting nexin [Tanacetum cinerariifolium]
WTLLNVSVPLLNLVDNVLQLNRRGCLRRQVFWISKQILQLMMEDAIDDWILRQIHWLRRDDIVASGIRWIQNSSVCLKQLAYGLLDLVIITGFPELHDVVIDVHEHKSTPLM